MREIDIETSQNNIYDKLESLLYTHITPDLLQYIDTFVQKVATDKQNKKIVDIFDNKIYIRNDIDFDIHSKYDNDIFILLPYFTNSNIREGDIYYISHRKKTIGKIYYLKKRDTCEEDKYNPGHILVGWQSILEMY